MSSAYPTRSRLFECCNGQVVLPFERVGSKIKKPGRINQESKCKCNRAHDRYAARTKWWFRECECHPARITFLTSSASRVSPRLCSTIRPLLPLFFSSSHLLWSTIVIVVVLSFSSFPPFSPWEGNLEGRRIKVSLPLHRVGLSWKNLHFEDDREKKSGKKAGACRRAIRCDNVVPVLETDVCERTCLSAGNKILVGASRRFDGFARASLPRKLDARFCVSRARSVVKPLVPRCWCKTEPRVSSIFAFELIFNPQDFCVFLFH